MQEISGQVASGFEPVAEAFEDNFDQGLELGAGFAAWVGDDCVVDMRGGWADRRKTRPWDEHTLVPVYSSTKPVSALGVCIALFAHLGDAPYDIPVAQVWPEFAANGKEEVTIGQLLSHQAGLSGFKTPIDPELWNDIPALANAIAQEAPLWPLGEGSGYHPVTWGYLVGELVQRIAGKSLGTILREQVTNADGANLENEVIDFWLGTPVSEHERVADIQRPTAPPDLGEITPIREYAFLKPLVSAQGRECDGLADNGNPLYQWPYHGARACPYLLRLRQSRAYWRASGALGSGL